MGRQGAPCGLGAEMAYLEDWQSSEEAMRSWWARDNDRPILAIYAPRTDGHSSTEESTPTPSPRDLKQAWCDVEFRIALARHHFKRTFYGGAACPTWWPNVGPTSLSAYYGCPVVLGDSTVWQEPIVTDWADAELVFDGNCEWWRLTVELTEAAAADARGEYLVGITDLGDAFDAMSHLSRPDELCIAMSEHPEQIQRARDQLLDGWLRCYDRLYRICQRNRAGSTHWLGTWSPGRGYVLQCDFSCMISTEMFGRFVIPQLERQLQWLDYSVYHLDGPGAVRHLDLLLNLPRLNAIQWVPGAGNRPPTGWIDLYRRIQAAGKGIHASASPDEVRPLLEQLGWRGLLIACRAESIEQAEYLLALPDAIAAEMSHKRVTT